MSAQIYMTVRERDAKTGAETERQIPYEPPQFPAREYIIEERATGDLILETPGGHRDGPPKPGEKKPTYIPEPYRPLRKAHDRMHATRYTPDEAKARAEKWGLTSATHRIYKPKNP